MVITNLLKILVFFLRTFTKSSATAIPGVLLEDYFPRTLKKMFSGFEKVILVTGTNGKTTTTQMICHLLERNGETFVTNRSGSNLLRGIAASILDNTDFWGRPKSKLAVFEIEEGSMRRLTTFVKPEIVIVTNIFRDQLDAYGEIDKTYRYIREAIQKFGNPTLILNGNDPRVSRLTTETNGKVLEIKVASEYLNQIKIEDSGTSSTSPNSIDPAKVDSYLVKNIQIKNDLSSSFDVEGLKGNFYKNSLKVPGLHNTINAGAAILAVRTLFESKSPKLDLSGFEPVFGRGEVIKVKGEKLNVKSVIPESAAEQRMSGIQESEGLDSRLRGNDKSREVEFQILLAKNPAGMNLNLHLLEHVENRDAILILLNDKIADGRDVSWIWDTDFSLLKSLNFKNYNLIIILSSAHKVNIRFLNLFIANFCMQNFCFYSPSLCAEPECNNIPQISINI